MFPHLSAFSGVSSPKGVILLTLTDSPFFTALQKTDEAGWRELEDFIVSEDDRNMILDNHRSVSEENYNSEFDFSIYRKKDYLYQPQPKRQMHKTNGCDGGKKSPLPKESQEER